MTYIEVWKDIEKIATVAKPILQIVGSSIQPEMKQFAERMLVLSEKYPSIEGFANAIDKCADIMGDILYVLGIEADAADIIGYKMAHAEKSVSEFDTIEDYLSYLKNEVQIDITQYNALSESEKLVYKIIGLSAQAAALGEKLDVIISADFTMLISNIVPLKEVEFKTEEIIDLIGKIKDAGIVRLDDICEYFSGEGETDRIRTGKIIKTIFEYIRPNEADDLIERIKDFVRA